MNEAVSQNRYPPLRDRGFESFSPPQTERQECSGFLAERDEFSTKNKPGSRLPGFLEGVGEGGFSFRPLFYKLYDVYHIYQT